MPSDHCPAANGRQCPSATSAASGKPKSLKRWGYRPAPPAPTCGAAWTGCAAASAKTSERTCSSVNQIQSDPAWSPEAHLEHVYRRGRQLRRRRQVGATSAVLAAVVGLAVMIGGTTSTVLQPLRTITGSGGGGADSV